MEAEKSSVVKSEEIWEGHSPGPQPFAALAVSQTPAWYDLVMLHLQLANVLHMMAHFNLKVSKPLNNLFDSAVSNEMIKEKRFRYLKSEAESRANEESLFYHLRSPIHIFSKT